MQRSKSNEFTKEVDRTSGLFREALLNTIRLAVREEIRAALIQGGFSFDDRLLDTEEASKVLPVSPDWLYRNSRKLPFTRRFWFRVFSSLAAATSGWDWSRALKRRLENYLTRSLSRCFQ